jgi:glycosyltransferase involved in cell wall biosynthesis
MAAGAMKPIRQLLVLAHGHPRWSIGGAENAAYAIHQAFAARPGWRSCFVAAAPSGVDQTSRQLPLCWPVAEQHEWLMRRSDDLLLLRRSFSAVELRWLEAWIRELQPDVVHVHQLIGLGLDVLLLIRRWLPRARIVFTLHEFMLLCPLRGQLLRLNGERCEQASLDDCARCLPTISPSRLWLRQEWFRTLLPAVDHWIAPSHTLCDRFVAGGWPAQRISVIDNLLPAALMESSPALVSVPPPASTVFGYFGTLSFSKGLDLLLEAFVLALAQRSDLRLQLHGPWPPDPAAAIEPLDRQFQERVLGLAADLGEALIPCGTYAQQQVCERMAGVAWVVMASRWLENSPVVIQEARLSQRPLLVPALGGMAEQVRHGVDGLHYPPDIPEALAATLLACAEAAPLPVRRLPGLEQERLVAEHESIFLGCD